MADGRPSSQDGVTGTDGSAAGAGASGASAGARAGAEVVSSPPVEEKPVRYALYRMTDGSWEKVRVVKEHLEAVCSNI